MVVHYKQIQRKRNRERETERYKRKRAKRMNRLIAVDMTIADPVCIEESYEIPFWTEGNLPKEEIEKYTTKPVKFNWFEKFILWIKKCLN